MDTHIHGWISNRCNTRWRSRKYNLFTRWRHNRISNSPGKHCTNYAAEVKALSKGVQAILDIVGNHKEDVVFLTDSKSVLDALACHGEHELRVKLSKLIESRRVVLQWIPAHCGIISGN